MATLAPWSIYFMPSMPHEFSFIPQNISNRQIPWLALLSRQRNRDSEVQSHLPKAQWWGLGHHGSERKAPMMLCLTIGGRGLIPEAKPWI